MVDQRVAEVEYDNEATARGNCCTIMREAQRASMGLAAVRATFIMVKAKGWSTSLDNGASFRRKRNYNDVLNETSPFLQKISISKNTGTQNSAQP